MKEITLHGQQFELYITAEQISQAIKALGLRLKVDFEDKNPLFVCIMNGAFMFASELMYAVDEGWEVAFARYSSYEGTRSTMLLKEIMPVEPERIKDRVVVIVEDLIDTGYTMKCVRDLYLQQGAKEVHIAAMLTKPDSIKCDVSTPYVAMEIEPRFIVGHGLDYDDLGRMYQDIYQLKD